MEYRYQKNRVLMGHCWHGVSPLYLLVIINIVIIIIISGIIIIASSAASQTRDGKNAARCDTATSCVCCCHL